MNQRTEKDGRQLVEDFKASGKTQREYAKEHGIKVATLLLEEKIIFLPDMKKAVKI